MLRALAVVFLISVVPIARADKAPEPTGPHPRILLDDTLRAAWKKQAQQADSPVAKAIARCEDTRKNPKDYKRDSYMGFDWNESLTSCLISWVVRGSNDDAASAMIFVRALLDDQSMIGDGAGGEKVVRRDTGYAIRSVPPFVALAYDWLHAHPAMTDAVKQKIRERFQQWLGWYKKEGYHNRSPATNYHAGYLFSASLAAIAIGGEAGEWGAELWAHVRDDIWATDMQKALAPKGLFDGGDFPEGWQYAPLSVAEYALTARIVGKHGVDITGIDRWLTATFVRTMHARSGALDTIAAIGDSEAKSASIKIEPMTMLAILIGPAPEITQRQALFEIQRLGLRSRQWPLFDAIALATTVTPAAPLLEKWPTAYYATGINAFYARTTWSKEGVWLATICPPQYDADHLPPSAGNLMITRGIDEVLVDPSPYGSLSSLTSNAPTVDSKQHLPKYRPSQGPWGETTHFVWAMQTASGVIASRCDYADQYKFQERPSDVPMAIRDIVLVPWGKADASAVIIDRADTGGDAQELRLRFRSPGIFALDPGPGGDVARTKVGSSTFTVRRVTPATAKPEVRTPKVDGCWEMERGHCDTTRIPVGEYRIAIPGQHAESIHVLDAAGTNDLAVATLGDGVVHLRRGTRDAYVASKPTSYTTKPSAGAIHVALADVPVKATVTSEGGACKVTLETEGVQREPGPFTFLVDDKCVLTEDARTGPAAPDLVGSGGAALISVGGPPKRSAKKGGCCDASGGAGSAALGVLIMAMLRRRRLRG